jgi:ProP effector
MIDANARATVALLCERFPKTFFMFELRRRPLKIGVHLDIAALLPTLSTKEIRSAMRWYTANRFYNKACVENAPRIDLDGNEVGVVSADEAAKSKQRVACSTAAWKRKGAAVKAAAEAAARARAEALAAARAAESEAARPKPKGVNAEKRTLHLKGMSSAN